MNTFDVAVIGAGPAGISAAIQLKRAGTEPLIIDAAGAGGNLKNANLIENYPGFPGGVSGVELSNIFKDHFAALGLTVQRETVNNIEYIDEAFLIHTNIRTISCRIVLIASGTRPRELTEPAIPADAKPFIFYEIFPLLNAEHKNIAIIGAGDAAFDYALNAARNNRVTIINRGSSVRCLPLLQERASKSDSISYVEATRVTKIATAGSGLRLTCRKDEAEWPLDVSYLIAALGREPNLDFLDTTITANLSSLQKSKKLYLIGDVARGIYRQTAIAAGDGIKAAMEITGIQEETPA